MLRMYGQAMESLNPGAAPPGGDMKAIEGGEQADLMGDEYAHNQQKAITMDGYALLQVRIHMY